MLICSVSDVIDKLKCEKLLSSTSKAPDHNIIVTKFTLPENLKISLAAENESSVLVNNKGVYNFSDIKSGFMNNSEWQQSIANIILKLDNNVKVKKELDNLSIIRRYLRGTRKISSIQNLTGHLN